MSATAVLSAEDFVLGAGLSLRSQPSISRGFICSGDRRVVHFSHRFRIYSIALTLARRSAMLCIIYMDVIPRQ